MMEAVVPEGEAAVMKSAAVKRMTAKAATVIAATMVTAVSADLDRKCVGTLFRCRHTGRIDRRQRLGALAGYGGQCQYRGRYKTKLAGSAAPRNSLVHHG
jgi:hypothetical protein